MHLLKNHTHKDSSRNQIQIRGIHQGILSLPNQLYSMALEVSSINFELMSEVEQDSLIDSFAQFLNSLSFPIQFLIRTREMDIDEYARSFQKHIPSENDDFLKEQRIHYLTFVRELIDTNKILSRHFYLILTLKAAPKQPFTMIHEQLLHQGELASSGLRRLHITTRKLDSIEYLNLFYSFYNEQESKIQPLQEAFLHHIHQSLINQSEEV